MTIRKQTSVVASALAVAMMMGWLPLAAQETAPKAAPSVRKKQDPSRRVPSHFGQIGLTTEQRGSIYGIQSRRLEKIEAMEKQIAAEKAAMLSECEGVLTDTQKKLLENLRRASAEPASKPANAPKPAD